MCWEWVKIMSDYMAKTSAYYATVEQQGRLTCIYNMLLWI